MPEVDNVYRSLVMAEAWRVVALEDRNPWSRTRGSFSRSHWAWKFDDFPYPRLQEGVYALCRLHDLDGTDNPFKGSAALARWIEWGFEYWIGRQHRNGSLDEAYPFEQCVAATAFTSFYLGQACLMWRARLDEVLRLRLEGALRGAGEWLCRHDEDHGILSNHLAAAVVALATIAEITGEERFRERARHFLSVIVAHQSAEGWMREYDGADIGYGTHAFFYLALYWRMTGCEKTLEALRSFARFLAHFMHPDGTLGGEYASRDTEFCYPAGFEILAHEIPECAAIAGFVRRSMAERRVCGPWAMDIFNFFPMYNNLLFALEAQRPLPSIPALPSEGNDFDRYFREAGLWIVNRPSYYAVAGLSKGGTVSVFDKRARRLAARHSGLIAVSKSGRVYTSQDCTPRPEVEWSDDGRSVRLRVPWKSLDLPVFDSWSFICFRLFTLTLGRLPLLSRWVKRALVAVLIRRKRRPSVRHSRRIASSPEGLTIEDEIAFPSAFERVQVLEHFTSIHMGSSLYADVRVAGPSSGSVEFPVRATFRLHGALTLECARWSASAD